MLTHSLPLHLPDYFIGSLLYPLLRVSESDISLRLLSIPLLSPSAQYRQCKSPVLCCWLCCVVLCCLVAAIEMCITAADVINLRCPDLSEPAGDLCLSYQLMASLSLPLFTFYRHVQQNKIKYKTSDMYHRWEQQQLPKRVITHTHTALHNRAGASSLAKVYTQRDTR